MTRKNSELTYLSRPANMLLDDFGAGTASPGSGSAAALMGLLSAKLVITVCAVTIRNSSDDKSSAKFEVLQNQVQNIIPKLEELFEKDAREFPAVVEAIKAKNSTDNVDDKRKFSSLAKDLLEPATDNVFEIIALCFKIISHSITAFDLGAKHVRGDSGAAISSAIAAVSAGLFVCTLNMKSIGKRVYVTKNYPRCGQYRQELERLQNGALERIISLDKEALTSMQGELPGIL